MLKFDNFFMVRLGFAFLAVAFSLILVNNAYAQTSDTQVTLSGDLQNNPVAQDILKKIEKSKKWIKQIQQRDFEQAEKQKELEQKRAEVLTILQDDLKSGKNYGIITHLTVCLKEH